MEESEEKEKKRGRRRGDDSQRVSPLSPSFLSAATVMGASAGACVCAIVRLCFFWLSCGSRVEKQLFFFSPGDVSSGEHWLWVVASHTGTKDPQP